MSNGKVKIGTPRGVVRITDDERHWFHQHVDDGQTVTATVKELDRGAAGFPVELPESENERLCALLGAALDQLSPAEQTSLPGLVALRAAVCD
jgi:hypothetical protein